MADLDPLIPRLDRVDDPVDREWRTEEEAGAQVGVGEPMASLPVGGFRPPLSSHAEGKAERRLAGEHNAVGRQVSAATACTRRQHHSEDASRGPERWIAGRTEVRQSSRCPPKLSGAKGRTGRGKSTTGSPNVTCLPIRQTWHNRKKTPHTRISSTDTEATNSGFSFWDCLHRRLYATCAMPRAASSPQPDLPQPERRGRHSRPAACPPSLPGQESANRARQAGPGPGRGGPERRRRRRIGGNRSQP